MDHNDAVLSEGKVSVTVPAEPVVVLLRLLQGVVVRGQHEGADIRPALAVEEDNLGLVCSHQEVT